MLTFRRLLHLAAPFRWWMALSALLGFLTIGSSIGLMSTAAWIIASAALHPHISTLGIAIVGVRFFGIARGVFRYLERYVVHQTTFRVLARLRVWFYQGIEPLAPARLVDHSSGDLLSRAVSDVGTLENFYLRVIAPPAIAVIVGLVMMIFMGAFDPRLAVSLVVFFLLAGVGMPLLMCWLSRELGVCELTTRSALNTAVIDGVQGLADLVACGAQHRHLEHIKLLNRNLQRQQARMARIGALNTALLSLLTGLALLSTLLIAIPLVHEGQLDGVLLAVLALATITSFEAVLPLPQAAQHLDTNLAAARRLFEIVDADPAVQDRENGFPTPPSLTGLERGVGGVRSSPSVLHVENLRFRYHPADPPALDGFSFTLSPGRTVAIVGASGAGKSTLVNLLLRFWDYDEGSIWLGERELRDYAQDDVRALFSVVSQSTYLFNNTIRENLRIARPHATDEDLIRAVQGAQLYSFIQSLPDGFDSWIGEMGLNLSGGERQRLAIARAILKDAPFLILDEATANLDAVTERAVLDTIHTVLGTRTTLMITHRLGGLDAAAEILVMQAGSIIERGRQADLLQTGGIYRRMWELQNQALVDLT